MYLNVNTDMRIEVPIMVDLELLNVNNNTVEVGGKTVTCTLDNGGEFVLIIVEDKTNQYTILHELVHVLQMMNIPIINECLNSICTEIKRFDPDYSEYITGWVNSNYTDLYDTDIGVDYSLFIHNEWEAHLITDVWEVDNMDINSFISMVTDLTGYEIVLLDESEWME